MSPRPHSVNPSLQILAINSGQYYNGQGDLCPSRSGSSMFSQGLKFYMYMFTLGRSNKGLLFEFIYS